MLAIWRDTDLQLRGPVVAELQNFPGDLVKTMARHWRLPFPAPGSPAHSWSVRLKLPATLSA
jgi:hypothetical protein